MRDWEWFEWLLAALVVMIVGLLVLGVYDCSTATTMVDQGCIYDKEYKAPYTTVDVHPDGRGGVYTTTTYHPEEFHLYVDTENHNRVHFTTGGGTYRDHAVGFCGSVTWRQGRWSTWGGSIK